jgi:uncharacterized integral membrane protein
LKTGGLKHGSEGYFIDHLMIAVKNKKTIEFALPVWTAVLPIQNDLDLFFFWVSFLPCALLPCSI